MEVVFVHALVDQRGSTECLSGTQDLIVGLQLDTFMPERAKSSLTCRCQMGDNRRSRVYFFLKPQDVIRMTRTLWLE